MFRTIFMGVFLSFLIVSPTFAASPELRGRIFFGVNETAEETFETSNDPNQRTALATTVGKAIQYALGALGIATVILFLYAGLVWMTAGGNTEKVAKAKGIMGQVVIGFAIISIAYGIVTFVLGAVLQP